MAIRTASPSDVSQMVRMERHFPLAAHWSAEQYEALFLLEAPPRIVLVEVDGLSTSTVRGFLVASCVTDEWEIESVVVDEAVQRRGFASSLMRELLGRAKTARASAVILEVRESNFAARQLYEKFGFIQESRRKDYYRGPLEPAILYRLLLQECDKIP